MIHYDQPGVIAVLTAIGPALPGHFASMQVWVDLPTIKDVAEPQLQRPLRDTSRLAAEGRRVTDWTNLAGHHRPD